MHIDQYRFTHLKAKCIYSSYALWTRAKIRIRGSRQLVIIGSAHKVGSTWLYRLITKCCCFRTYSLSKSIIDRHPQKQRVDIDLCDILSEQQLPMGGYVYKTHSYPPPEDFVSELPDWVKFVTVLRDPRDVIVSSSFYLARLPVCQGGWGEDFLNLDTGERILRIIENGDFLRFRLRDWFQCPYAYKVRYEQLLSDPIGEIQQLLSFLGVDVAEGIIHQVNEKLSFKRQTGRSPGQENKEAFLRKGISGDWRNYFNNEVKRAFKHSCDGDWNNLLVALGYEKNLDW